MKKKVIRALMTVVVLLTSFAFGGCAFKSQQTIKSLDQTIDATKLTARKSHKITTIEKEELKKDLLQHANRLLKATPNSPEILHIPGYYKNRAGNRKAVVALQNDSQAALVLSLAYRLTGSEKYALKAIDFMTAWALACRGVKDRESKFNLTYKGFRFLQAYQYLGDFDWNRGPFKVWIKYVYRPTAEEIRQSANNFGSWGCLGCIMADSILDPASLGHRANELERHIRRSIGPNGELFHETKRTLAGIWYSYFSLAPILRAAMELEKHGFANLYPLILPGFDWFFQYCANPDSWPYRPLPGPLGKIQKLIWPHSGYLDRPRKQNGWPAHLLEVAAGVYNRPQWLEWIKRPNTVGGHCFEYSTLLLSEGCL